MSWRSSEEPNESLKDLEEALRRTIRIETERRNRENITLGGQRGLIIRMFKYYNDKPLMGG